MTPIKENCQKIKLLKLMEILKNETDEDNPLSTSELCAKLNELNISCDPKTLSRDMKTLNRYGYEVMSDANKGHEKAYYISDREFSIPELKIMIDAVQAASFITRKKTDELIPKIAALAGRHKAKELCDNHVRFNTRKHGNEFILYNVDMLESAITKKKKASFFYFDLKENGEKAYRKNKERYVVEPIALIFNEDNYYLMSYNPKYNEINNFRVDRMECVDVEDEPICKDALLPEEEIARYTEQVFKMYGGSSCENIVIEFEEDLLNSVFDKFGEDTKVERIDENLLCARVCVQISPTFYGWLLQFGGKMKITSPESVKAALKSFVDNICASFN